WHTKHPAAPRPLYGLNRLSTMPDARPILCEGEKAADAAQRLFPDRPCVSWPAGTGGVADADWTPLANREFDLWPDADEPGLKAAREIAARLPNARVINVEGLPGGFDAADLEQQGCEDPEAWLRDRLTKEPIPDDEDAEPELGIYRAKPIPGAS